MIANHMLQAIRRSQVQPSEIQSEEAMAAATVVFLHQRPIRDHLVFGHRLKRRRHTLQND
jgi:hypothetical protein